MKVTIGCLSSSTLAIATSELAPRNLVWPVSSFQNLTSESFVSHFAWNMEGMILFKWNFRLSGNALATSYFQFELLSYWYTFYRIHIQLTMNLVPNSWRGGQLMRNTTMSVACAFCTVNLFLNAIRSCVKWTRLTLVSCAKNINWKLEMPLWRARAFVTRRVHNSSGEVVFARRK